MSTKQPPGRRAIEESRQPDRQRAFRPKALLGVDREEAFDRITRLVCRLLGVPSALLLLVDDERLFVKSSQGLKEPPASEPDAPLAGALYTRVIVSGEPFQIDDAGSDPRLGDSSGSSFFGAAAALGFPLVTNDGCVVGALCALDAAPRPWSDEDRAALADLAELVMTEVRLRRRLAESQENRHLLHQEKERYRSLISVLSSIVWKVDAQGRFTEPQPEWERYTGQPWHAHHGFGWADAIYPEDRPGLLADWQKAVETRSPYRAEARIYHAQSDAYRWFIARAVPVFGEDGTLIEWIGTVTDVHDEQEIVDTLRQTRRRLDDAMAAGAIGSWMWDVPRDLVQADERFAFYFGLDPAEAAAGTSIEAFVSAIHEGDRAYVEARIEEAIKTGQPYESEYRVRGADGAYRWVAARGRVEYDPDGAPLRFPGVLTDVSDRKQVEAERQRLYTALETERAHLEAVLQHMPMAVIIAEAPTGRLVMGNDRVAEIWRHAYIPSENVDGYEAYKGFRPDGSPLPADEWPLARSLRHGEVVRGEEVRFERGDGTRGYLRLSSAPIRDRDGDITAAVVIFDDVTAEKEADQALRVRERELTTMANSIPQLAWMADPEGSIFWYNQRWYDYTGTTPEEMKGWGWKEVQHPEHVDRVMARISEVWETGEPWEDLFPLRGRDGEYRWFLSRALPVRDDEGRIVRWLGTNTDVTEQREMEQALRASEERYRLATRAANDVIWDWDVRNGKVSWSSALETVFGYAPDMPGPLIEEAWAWWSDRIHPEDREQVTAHLNEAIEQGRDAWSAEYRFLRADGTYASVVDWGAISHDEDGQPVRVVGSMQDISERQELLRRIERDRALFEAVLQQMPAALIVAAAPSGELILANEQVDRILKHPFQPAEGIEQYAAYHALHPDGTPYAVEDYPLARALLHGETTHGKEIEYVLDDGEKAVLLVNAAPVRDPDGGMMAGLVSFIDITERKKAEEELRLLNETLEARVRERTAELEAANDRLAKEVHERAQAEQALRESEGRFRSLITDVIDRLPVGVFILDHTFRIVWINQAMADFFGIDRDEAIGGDKPTLIRERFSHLFEEADLFAQRVLATYADNTYAERFECHVLGGDGRADRWLEHRSKPIYEGYYAGGRVELYTDITEAHRAFTALDRTNRELKQRNRELQEFAYVASHDLQEPLRKIRAFADLIQVEYEDRLDDEGMNYLERMSSAAERMATLITDLLSFSRVMTQGMPFNLIDLGQVANEVLSDLQVSIDESGAVVDVDELPEIEADPTQMRQLLQNLISNALKFHKPDEQPHIRIEARIVESRGGRSPQCILKVRDDGIGFNKRYADKIFMPFQRLHGRAEYQGTGIGLAICRRIAERHGGTISAESRPGAGSTFTVVLPVRHPQPAPAPDSLPAT